jgi:hypothetical protein
MTGGEEDKIVNQVQSGFTEENAGWLKPKKAKLMESSDDDNDEQDDEDGNESKSNADDDDDDELLEFEKEVRRHTDSHLPFHFSMLGSCE